MVQERIMRVRSAEPLDCETRGAERGIEQPDALLDGAGWWFSLAGGWFRRSGCSGELWYSLHHSLGQLRGRTRDELEQQLGVKPEHEHQADRRRQGEGFS